MYAVSMGIRIFILLFLWGSLVSANDCKSLLENPSVQSLRQFIMQSEHDDYLLTVDRAGEMVIVTSVYKPQIEIQLIKTMDLLELKYEVLEFFGRTAFHIKY